MLRIGPHRWVSRVIPFPTIGIRARRSGTVIGGGIGEHRVLTVSTIKEALRGDSAGAQSGTVKLIGLGPEKLT